MATPSDYVEVTCNVTVVVRRADLHPYDGLVSGVQASDRRGGNLETAREVRAVHIQAKDEHDARRKVLMGKVLSVTYHGGSR